MDMAQNMSTATATAKASSGTSRFEQVIANNLPILSSLVAQLPTESILNLYHTSRFLKSFFQHTPTSWRHLSWRLHQPSPQTQTPVPVTNNQNGHAQPRQSSNYALDQLLMYVIIPFSTRLTSLVLDNTAVSGATLFQTVIILRKDTLEHVSVRGCKNVSLKYHINPWLTMHAMALEQPKEIRPLEYRKLALKSLYTYRCRHHRRRPYLPSSLSRKESDSEPTHDLVLTCHKLGIWTDTAWCTTPGARCFRRRGYVTMRVQQDPREVWVVFDRLWRSRNWLGPLPSNRDPNPRPGKRKREGRVWEEEDAYNGEPVGLGPEGKDVPAHLRQSHKRFVGNIRCDNCSTEILERCEQCSVMMHCSGCRKTLCASCAFDRPYLRNKNASEEDKQKFWWAPGFAVSPCSMQDADPAAGIPNQPTPAPNIKFKWCCTEPVFSGGGGITLGTTQNHDSDRLRAAPLAPGEDFEDPEFAVHEHESGNEVMGEPLSRSTVSGPGGRWTSLTEMFRYGTAMTPNDEPESIPRILCDGCHSSEQWKIKCKACSVALCLKHDVKEKQRVRICGYKELSVEKQEYMARVKATRLFRNLWLRRKEQQDANRSNQTEAQNIMAKAQLALAANTLLEDGQPKSNSLAPLSPGLLPPPTTSALSIRTTETQPQTLPSITDTEPVARPISPGSNSTGPLSRSSSPAPSARSATATPDPTSSTSQTQRGKSAHLTIPPSNWKGCQAFFCPATRPTGDHRRRCTAVMRQCSATECRIFVCDDCVGTLDVSCPCKGCRLPDGETDPITGSTAAFYCPNCRHSRIISRKCHKKLAMLLAKENSSARRAKSKSKSLLDATSSPSKDKQNFKRPPRPRMTPQERLLHIPNILLDSPTPTNLPTLAPLAPQIAIDPHYNHHHHHNAFATTITTNRATTTSATSTTTDADTDFTLDLFYDSIDHELRELQEISVGAMEVVRKVQRLRSAAVVNGAGGAGGMAMAREVLPNIVIQEEQEEQDQDREERNGVDVDETEQEIEHGSGEGGLGGNAT